MPHITRIRRIKVSTHSRLKAAGLFTFFINANVFGFNTQPPEGGWCLFLHEQEFQSGFNTQPPEGGWRYACSWPHCAAGFNTQPPEGGWAQKIARPSRYDSFNTQPPEGGWILNCSKWLFSLVSTHSRLKAAGLMVHNPVQAFFVSTHSRLKAAGKI